jgi:D-tagatose-1,6-bisphosphate aldolase subunit GatZ/KbaZ
MEGMRGAPEKHGEASAFLIELLRANTEGKPVGLFSICSANKYVLEAGVSQAVRDGSILCIESTSNQVNQFGGYTGSTPAQFARFAAGVAEEGGLPRARMVLGGDHLGPHVWQSEPASRAMERARELVRGCILAGYTKIHLDTSMPCADDLCAGHAALPDEVVMQRAADLCRVAEEARDALPAGAPAPIYVVGTEVPAPGGAQAEERAPHVTAVEDVERTIASARKAFRSSGMHQAWERVVALVVQPGVEFGDATVFEYDREKTRQLSSYAGENRELVYEAHSTDYQSPEKLRQMVEDHFAILKVGPGLTFAFREAVFALEAIERELLAGRRGVALSEIRETLEKAMIENPVYWRKYYRGDEAGLRYARSYSYSDRSRYYWPDSRVQSALLRLLGNLSATSIPGTLISQYLPMQYRAVRDGDIPCRPTDLIRHKVLEVLNAYARACGMRH